MRLFTAPSKQAGPTHDDWPDQAERVKVLTPSGQYIDPDHPKEKLFRKIVNATLTGVLINGNIS